MKKYEHITNEQIEQYEYVVQQVMHKIRFRDEDLAQELRVEICKALTTYNKDKNDNIGAYIHICLHNRAKYYLRSNAKYQNEIPFSTFFDYLDTVLIDSDMESIAIIESLKEILTEEELKIIILKHVKLHTFLEIAIELDYVTSVESLTKNNKNMLATKIKRKHTAALEKLRNKIKI